MPHGTEFSTSAGQMQYYASPQDVHPYEQSQSSSPVAHHKYESTEPQLVYSAHHFPGENYREPSHLHYSSPENKEDLPLEPPPHSLNINTNLPISYAHSPSHSPTYLRSTSDNPHYQQFQGYQIAQEMPPATRYEDSYNTAVGQHPLEPSPTRYHEQQIWASSGFATSGNSSTSAQVTAPVPNSLTRALTMPELEDSRIHGQVVREQSSLSPVHSQDLRRQHTLPDRERSFSVAQPTPGYPSQQLDFHHLEGEKSLQRQSGSGMVTPPFIVKSSGRTVTGLSSTISTTVAAAAHLHVPVPPSDIHSATSHEARAQRRRSSGIISPTYQPYPKGKEHRDQQRKEKGKSVDRRPSATNSTASQSSTQGRPQVIAITERPVEDIPAYHPNHTSGPTPFIPQEADLAGSNGPQTIKFSSPDVIESRSKPSSKGAKAGHSVKVASSSRSVQLDASGEKKPFLACKFCRQRKIACGAGPHADNTDLPPGPRTCK